MGTRRKKPIEEAKTRNASKRILQPKRTLRRIQNALSLDLLHPNYPPSDEQLIQGCTGHCYVATEAAFHLFGKKLGFVPYMLRHDFGTHWWLMNEETGEVLDPTEPQLNGEDFDYQQGRRQAFLTRRPSKRAAELMRRVRTSTK